MAAFMQPKSNVQIPSAAQYCKDVIQCLRSVTFSIGTIRDSGGSRGEEFDFKELELVKENPGF